MKRILVLSNGHGEDLSGSFLAKKLICNGYEVDALPIVGKGKNYIREKINILGKTKDFNTGGLGYNSLKGRINDLLNGQIIYFLRKLLLVLRNHKNYDYLLIVGDIVPIFFAWASKKKFFVYLVAYSSHYEGKLKLPWPCKYFLISKKVERIFARDQLTASDLTNQLQRKVHFLGNPFMERLNCQESLDQKLLFDISFFPGSRSPEIVHNFLLMIDILESMSKFKFFQNISFNFALVNAFNVDKIKEILKSRHWIILRNSKKQLNCLKFQIGFIQVSFKWNSFDEILYKSDLVISMAGTAAEQAIGCSKPVIQIEGNGPQFTKSFAEAQRRLLGEFVFCATDYKSKKEQIDKTVNLIIQVMYLMKIDKRFLISCKKNSLKRIGKDGACTKLVNEINNVIINENKIF